MWNLFYWSIRTPIRNLWFDWQHRHETTEQRRARIEETKKRFREAYNRHRARWAAMPATKDMYEFIELMDDAMDRAEKDEI